MAITGYRLFQGFPARYDLQRECKAGLTDCNGFHMGWKQGTAKYPTDPNVRSRCHFYWNHLKSLSSISRTYIPQHQPRIILPCLFLVDFGTHVWSSSGTKKNIFVTPCWCIIGAETKCTNNNIYGWFLILYPPVFVLKYLRLFIPSYRLKPWKLTFKTLAEYHWTQIYVQWQYLRKRKIRIWKNTWLLFLGSWPDLTWMCSLGILCG